MQEYLSFLHKRHTNIIKKNKYIYMALPFPNKVRDISLLFKEISNGSVIWNQTKHTKEMPIL